MVFTGRGLQRALMCALSFGQASSLHRSPPQGPDRRSVLLRGAAVLAALPLSAVTASAPPDGLFPDCPDANVCVSSQDDRPQCWDNPWIAEEELSTAMLRLRSVVEKRLKGTVTDEDERYLRAEFRSAGPFGGSGALDVAEFYFTPNDVLVQFRAARQGASGLEQDFGANRNRLEQARVALGWEKVPVLRNRRRALVVVESPLDSFGPAMNGLDELGFTAREMVPAETKQSDIYRDLDPRSPSWQAPTKAMRARRAEDLGQAVEQWWVREGDDRVRSK